MSVSQNLIEEKRTYRELVRSLSQNRVESVVNTTRLNFKSIGKTYFKRCLISSDEIETLYVLAKVVVRNGNSCFWRSFCSISDQVGESVSILDGCWDLNGSSNIIVGIAQLVRQRLNLRRVSSCRIIHYHVMSRAHYSLSRNLTYEEEVIRVVCYYSWIYNCAWQWIYQSLWVLVVKESLIYSFIYKHNHYFYL